MAASEGMLNIEFPNADCLPDLGIKLSAIPVYLRYE
jgi:hypothetical protein